MTPVSFTENDGEGPAGSPTGQPTVEAAHSGPARRGEREIEEIFQRLLAAHPDAALAAMNAAGFYAPMPKSLDIGLHPVVEGRGSGLDLVAPHCAGTVLDGWKRAHETGFGSVTAEPADGSAATLTLHIVDLQARHGVLVVVAVYSDGPRRAQNSFTAGSLPHPRFTIAKKNELSEFIDVDPAFTAILGYSRDEIIGRRNLDLIHPEDQARAISNWLDMAAVPGSSSRVRLRQKHISGRWVWFEITQHNGLDRPTDPAVVCEMIDISEEMTVQESLRAREQLLQRLTDSLPLGVVQIDGAGTVVHHNARLTSMLGLGSVETVRDVFAHVVAPDAAVLDASVRAALSDGIDAEAEVGVTPEGRVPVRCRVTVRALTTGDRRPNGALLCVFDVTEQARLRARLEDQATYDALTRCHNRASIRAFLERALLDAGRESVGAAAVFIDLDGFKQVNDRHGHAEGDLLLQRIASALQRTMRDGDAVGRLGGDEFLAVARNVPTPEHALRLAQRLAEELAGCATPEPPHQAVASIGVAWRASSQPLADETARRQAADEIVRRADAAMYESKAVGTGQPVLRS